MIRLELNCLGRLVGQATSTTTKTPNGGKSLLAEIGSTAIFFVGLLGVLFEQWV